MRTTALAATATVTLLLGGVSWVQGADRLKVQYSTKDRNTASDPALFQATWPEDGEDSWGTHLGVIWNVLSEDLMDRWTVGPSAEYHRNTETDAEQNTLMAGGTVIRLFGDVTEGSAHFLQGTAHYKSDRVASSASLQVSGDYTPLIPHMLIGRANRSRAFAFLWQPSGGLEYENVINAPSGGDEGHVGRVHGQVEVAFYPAPERLEMRLEIVFANAHWQDFSESDALDPADENHHKLFTASAWYYLDSQSHWGVGVDFVNGENPTESMPDQQYVQLSLKVKY